MVWRPLHVRHSALTEGQHEGVPAHLSALLWEWVNEHVTSGGNYQADRIRLLALMARLPIEVGGNSIDAYSSLQWGCLNNEQGFLNVVDAILVVQGDRRNAQDVDKLRQYLSLANSAWTASPDNSCLTRRVDPTAEAAAVEAVRPSDAASEELAEAWRKAYGRDPDGSDAWDHSIKAVEHIYKPIVSPKNDRATLGTIIRELENSQHLYKFVLRKADGSEVGYFLSTLRMLWPNPDRHGSGQTTSVSLAEAQSAVQLAVTLVQWGRTSSLSRRP